MTTHASTLYLNIDPGVLEMVCSFLHPKYKEFLFRQWDKLSKEECLHFCETYKHTEIFRSVWDRFDLVEKQDIWNQYIVISVQKDMMALTEFLMSVRHIAFSTNFYDFGFREAVKVAERKRKTKVLKYLQNYHKLTQKETPLSRWRRTERVRKTTRSRFFR
jgi:hypothetical protein